jgi:hypothetical protein
VLAAQNSGDLFKGKLSKIALTPAAIPTARRSYICRRHARLRQIRLIPLIFRPRPWLVMKLSLGRALFLIFGPISKRVGGADEAHRNSTASGTFFRAATETAAAYSFLEVKSHYVRLSELIINRLDNSERSDFFSIFLFGYNKHVSVPRLAPCCNYSNNNEQHVSPSCKFSLYIHQ